MDLDLFGAFEGTETVKHVEAVPPVAAKGEATTGGERGGANPSKKRRRVENGGGERSPGGGGGGGGADDDSGEEEGEEGGSLLRRAAEAATTSLGSAGLVEGADRVVQREDGTTVKSYSVYPADWKRDSAELAAEEEGAGGPTRPPAKTYPFVLDPFQAQAISYIERNESVLVSAHTSAGKTVNAEYAIAKSLRDGQKVIYTSPIKALSNQKYRDLQEEFGDVGLMTGDITINPSAQCLIMTTEILRSMLYRGSEIMREVAWVIYDEVHYMRDKSRGVVWEESIILLPHKVRFVFLSATIPNAKEFVGWVAKMHHQPCHVVYTDYRPTPLEHYIFPQSGDGLHLVVDSKGRFREDNFSKAMASLQATPEEQAVATGSSTAKIKKKNQKADSDLKRIVQVIMEKELDPVIVFSFSKKDCENYAVQMKKFDFNTYEEKELVSQVFTNAMESLSDEDRKLPQVEALLPLLKSGIGIHHGGLLPILKEVIEILFQEQLIKVLFATETFSIGLNMPARTVVFTTTRKYDGTDFRWVTSGEYIQMSGRAGRRGKDKKGTVIQMLEEKMDPATCKDILYGEADALTSSYHIGYSMLLNMMRVEGADPEFLVKSSFHQYQQEQEAPALEAEAEELMQERASIVIEREEEVQEYFKVMRLLQQSKKEIQDTVRRPQHCLPFMQVGRIIEVEWGSGGSGGGDGGSGGSSNVIENKKQVLEEEEEPRLAVGAMVNLHKKAGKVAGEFVYTLEMLLPCAKKGSSGAGGSASGGGTRAADGAPQPQPAPRGAKASEIEYQVVPVLLSSVMKICTIRVKMPKDLKQPENRTAVGKSVKEVQRRLVELPPLDPIEDMSITDKGFATLVNRAQELQTRLLSLKFHTAEDRASRLLAYKRKDLLLEKAKALRKQSKSMQTVAMRDDMRRMKRVLRRLGHCDANNVIQLKGRVACEINTADELLVTELIFNGTFSGLSPAVTVALLSCMVAETSTKDSSEGPPNLPEELLAPFRKLQDTARQVAKVQVDSKVTLDTEEYVKGFGPDLMQPSFAWANGSSFVDVMALTDQFEGSVVRSIRRLEELLRQLSQASQAIGNMELKKLFEEGADLCRRGIIFAASLYL